MPNIHPLLVHFPIALIFMVAIFDLIGALSKNRSFVFAANALTVFAAVGAIAAVVSGILAEGSIWHPGAAHDLLETHETVGFVFLGIIVVLAIFRFVIGDRIYGSMGWIAVLIGVIGVTVVSYGGYLGGEMVYTHGAGVKQAEVSTARADSLEKQININIGEEDEEPDNDTDDGHDLHNHEH